MTTAAEYDPDPVAIREVLQAERAAGSSFEDAWRLAVGPFVNCDLYRFMRKHFKAAYQGDESAQGRCMVPGRDVSSAIPVQTFTGPNDAVRRIPQVLPPARHDHERCRSGDGCDRLATRGRYGMMWCEHHGAELERLAGDVSLARSKADPRNGGNNSLYTHKAA